MSDNDVTEAQTSKPDMPSDSRMLLPLLLELVRADYDTSQVFFLVANRPAGPTELCRSEVCNWA
jgi:hypothetical protein